MWCGGGGGDLNTLIGMALDEAVRRGRRRRRHVCGRALVMVMVVMVVQRLMLGAHQLWHQRDTRVVDLHLHDGRVDLERLNSWRWRRRWLRQDQLCPLHLHTVHLLLLRCLVVHVAVHRLIRHFFRKARAFIYEGSFQLTRCT